MSTMGRKSADIAEQITHTTYALQKAILTDVIESIQRFPNTAFQYTIDFSNPSGCRTMFEISCASAMSPSFNPEIGVQSAIAISPNLLLDSDRLPLRETRLLSMASPSLHNVSKTRPHAHNPPFHAQLKLVSLEFQKCGIPHAHIVVNTPVAPCHICNLVFDTKFNTKRPI